MDARHACAKLIGAAFEAGAKCLNFTKVVGLAVAAVYGTPRMGPAFGAMLLSGLIGAEQINEKLGKS